LVLGVLIGGFTGGLAVAALPGGVGRVPISFGEPGEFCPDTSFASISNYTYAHGHIGAPTPDDAVKPVAQAQGIDPAGLAPRQASEGRQFYDLPSRIPGIPDARLVVGPAPGGGFLVEESLVCVPEELVGPQIKEKVRTTGTAP
jgi:hypothetical protein